MSYYIVFSRTCLDWPVPPSDYLLVGETDVAEARGSWEALKKLGR